MHVVADLPRRDRDGNRSWSTWLRQALGLPEGFSGTLQGLATTATFCAVLVMRERALGWKGLTEGLSGGARLRIYASAQTHSSIDKAVRLAGIGQENLVKIPRDRRFRDGRRRPAAGHRRRPRGGAMCLPAS